MRAFFFVVWHAFRWTMLGVFVAFVLKATFFLHSHDDSMLGIFVPLAMAIGVVTGYSQVQRVRLITSRSVLVPYGNRHRRQIEIPFSPDESFAVVDAAIRELPYVDGVESAHDSLQVRARVRRDVVHATITPGDETCSLALVCHPQRSIFFDWFFPDHGTNLENAEAITRAVMHRIAERRKGERQQARDTATDKELAIAKLSLLHAQVEPHFLYNTLASAQVLTRSDPGKAEQMLGYLIEYLRHSLPRAGESMSTLGEELARAKAYLEILRIRMGDRLRLEIQVPEALRATPIPPMMLQTLVENAIKHGLEPSPAGGTVWIRARETDGKVAVVVADDGRGFSEGTSGTGIGLKNVRERLKLAYGDEAHFSIGANFPKGVNATIVVPARTAAAPAEGQPA